jgi:hypothetical protein
MTRFSPFKFSISFYISEILFLEHKMKKVKRFGAFGLLALVLLGCEKKSNLLLKVHFNKINISWNGKERISGGEPLLENTLLKYHETREIKTDSNYVFEFLHNFKDHVEITAKVSEKGNSILFYLSPNNFHTQKAKDFVGIFFDSIPQFQKANVFYKYNVGATWANSQTYSSIHQIKPLNNELIIWKYTDGTFAACLPLFGKGYKTSIGNYKNHFGLKAYHSINGHNENDIPIMALAFGKNMAEVLKTIHKSAQGKSVDLDSLLQIKEFKE